MKSKVDAAPGGNVVRKRRRPWMLLSILFLLIVPVLLISLYGWITVHFTYSNGERAGYIQKISKKGWVCKTWEGELAITNYPGSAPQIFAFTVPDDRVARQIMDAAGQRVALTYEQHKGVPSSCYGETEYWITGVRPLGR